MLLLGFVGLGLCWLRRVVLVCGYLQFMLVIRLFVCPVIAYERVVGVLI